MRQARAVITINSPDRLPVRPVKAEAHAGGAGVHQARNKPRFIALDLLEHTPHVVC